MSLDGGSFCNGKERARYYALCCIFAQWHLARSDEEVSPYIKVRNRRGRGDGGRRQEGKDGCEGVTVTRRARTTLGSWAGSQ